MSKKGTISTHSMILRVSKIHELIAGKTYPTTEKLSKKLEVSTATISRDIEFLRDSCNAPIEYDSSRRGYYYSDDNYIPQYINLKNNKKKAEEVFNKEEFAKYINVPLSTIENLEKLSDLEIEGQSELEANLSCKYCGRSYYNNNIWIGIKAFPLIPEYKLCLSIYEGYLDKKKTVSGLLQSQHLNYIAEDAAIDYGYWLYIILDDKFLTSDINISQKELKRLIKFIYPNAK
ncbi:MAG: HTH domain-containing protein [Treponema sp.]|nr:HTH domain-containing protein [Treponema sp.]